MKQTEFSFAGPPILSEDERFVKFLNDMSSMMDKVSPNWRQSIRDVLDAFKETQPMNEDGPSFPLTIVVGHRYQPEFDFAVLLYKEQWEGLDVQMHCDIHHYGEPEPYTCHC